MINFNSNSNAMAPSLLNGSLDLRFYSEEERSVAMILVGLTGAFCEVSHVHKYNKNFRGGPFEIFDPNANESEGELRQRPYTCGYSYKKVRCYLDSDLRVRCQVYEVILPQDPSKYEPKTHDARQYYIRAVYEYLYGSQCEEQPYKEQQ